LTKGDIIAIKYNEKVSETALPRRSLSIPSKEWQMVVPKILVAQNFS